MLPHPARRLSLKATREHSGMELRRSDGSVVAVDVAGDTGATPILFCHGLADSRLSADWFRRAAQDLGLCVIVPDRPGSGGTDLRLMSRLEDWVADAALVLDALRAEAAAVLGISGGGPFAAACAAVIPDRVRSLTLIAPLGAPDWPTAGMAAGERLSLAVGRRAPAFGGWVLGRLAALARRSPRLFLRLVATELPDADIRALQQCGVRESFLASYVEAFRHGSGGVAQDLRVLTRPWGFDLGSITVPALIRHGDADLTVPVQHARRYADAIPGARLHVDRGHGHFSIFGSPQEILAGLAG
jgi:pimeloyl-ACP methyl ester carboxylesterase